MSRSSGGRPGTAAHSFLYGEELDFPRRKKAPQLYVCLDFVPRSGSNLLADLMRQTGRLGFPLEYFSPANLNDLASRIRGLSLTDLTPLFERRTSPNGVFSYKWNSDFEGLADAARAVRPLAPKKRIFVDRRDLDAQARSYLVAHKTGVWARQKGVSHDARRPDLTAAELDEAKAKLAAIRSQTLALVQADGDEFLTVYAEDLFEQPARTLEQVMEFCEISTEGLSLPSESVHTSPSS